MNQIQELPAGAPGFGHDFNYAVWTPNTSVTLVNVPWNSDYRDVVRFADRSALDNYLDHNAGPVTNIGGMSYAPMNQPVMLPIPFGAASRYNYLRAHNPAQPISGGDTPASYYYFISEVRYVAPDTTELVLQLDVWQTFGYGATFGNCYIERGHVGIANENQFADNGREYLTMPEGLDMGGEYQIIDQWSRSIATARNRVPGDAGAYAIMVTSTVALDKDPGTGGESPKPKLNTATGSQLENLPNGAETYLFQSLAAFKAFITAFSDKPWVTQGIIGITAVPPASEYGMGSTGSVVGGVTVLRVDSGSLTSKKTEMNTSWRQKIVLGPGGRYQGLKKFLTYPYTVLEMTSYTGTPLVLKPESWSDAHATVVEVPHLAQPGPRIMFYPYRYNAAQPGPDPVTDPYGVVNDGGEFLDMATGITNFPTFSTLNSGYQMFMASNANSIAFQHSSADWSQQRALGGNELSAEQATGAIGTSQNINNQQVNAASASTTLANETAGWSALQSAGNSVVRAGMGAAGGPAGLAMGVANGALGAANAGASYAIQLNQNNQALGISNTLSRGTNAAQNDQAGFVRDSNKAYGDWAAKGDYQNAIAGVNAKVQDARMIQPTTSGQLGGDAFNLATYKWGYDIKVKMLQPAAMSSIGEYWLRYGYSVNRFGQMPENFMVMENFTYWKLKETYIRSSECPESFKQALRGIFEKGVTVWSNPSDIGNIDIADNAPLAGIQL